MRPRASPTFRIQNGGGATPTPWPSAFIYFCCCSTGERFGKIGQSKERSCMLPGVGAVRYLIWPFLASIFSVLALGRDSSRHLTAPTCSVSGKQIASDTARRYKQAGFIGLIRFVPIAASPSDSFLARPKVDCVQYS